LSLHFELTINVMNAVLLLLQGKPEPSAAAVPPPPPTVAPKPAPERKPKVRQAYRRPKQSTEDRKQQLQEEQEAAAASKAGHEEVLSAEALAAKAAAVQADASITQQWWRHVVQPVTDLVPALDKHPSRDLSTRSTRNGSSNSSKAQQSLPTLLVIDGFNLLHQHPSTKRLIDDGDMYAAQQHLHTLLRQYAEQKKRHILVVYDAYRVPSRSGSSTRSQQTLAKLDYRVSTLYEAGKEADTVIIELVSNVLTREAAAAAQGHLGAQAPQLCNIHVHTNDNRIQEAVTVASMAAEQQVRRHIVHVNCMSNTRLSEAMAPVENKMHSRRQQQPLGGLSWQQGSSQLPDPQQHTEAWARAYLAASGSDSDSDTETGGSSSSNNSSTLSRRRRRRLTQEQEEQQEAAAAAALVRSLSDEQLLQLSGAADARAAFVAGAAAVSADSTWDEADASPSTPAAAAAAAAAAAGALIDTVPAAPGEASAGRKSSSVGGSSSSRSTSQQLDEVLHMDLDSLLDDIL
jgi:predicted RNA-binding protein with PIN domain